MWDLFVFALLAGLSIGTAIFEHHAEKDRGPDHPVVYHPNEISILLTPHRGHQIY